MKLEKLDKIYHALKSLSSRRAWIEIQFPPYYYYDYNVALLAEGVD